MQCSAVWLLLSGTAQGVVTGIRGLCTGLGPALFGFVFYLFHVDLNLNVGDDGIRPPFPAPRTHGAAKVPKLRGPSLKHNRTAALPATLPYAYGVQNVCTLPSTIGRLVILSFV